jgi:hypothetical protein
MTLLLPRCYRHPSDSKIGTKQKEARKPVEQPAPRLSDQAAGRSRRSVDMIALRQQRRVEPHHAPTV